jgi:hypothetical protein
MAVFRRSSAGATDGTAQDSVGAKNPGAAANETARERPPAEAKKGRPTPKRSEAERDRYASIQGGRSSGTRTTTSGSRPATPRTPEQKARDRDRERTERTRRTDAMRRGEEWALGPRDKGAARKLARDYVDAHRRPSEFYMYALILLLVALFVHDKALNSYVSYLVMALVAVIVIDGFFIRRALSKLIAERLPGESTRGLTMYAVMRALQIRRMRMPTPRLKPGDEF